MASLPEARLGTSLRCFAHYGVDFAGPLVPVACLLVPAHEPFI